MLDWSELNFTILNSVCFSNIVIFCTWQSKKKNSKSLKHLTTKEGKKCEKVPKFLTTNGDKQV
jgi:hypothetical protein